jgi:hypothetical protein
MLHNLFLTVHVPTHNVYVIITCIKCSAYEALIFFGEVLKRSSEDRLPSTKHMPRSRTFSSAQTTSFYHNVVAIELATKRCSKDIPNQMSPEGGIL